MIIPISQRIISILIYILPFCEGIAFGGYLFNEFPMLKLLVIPTMPIIYIQQLIPFGSLILYISCFIFIIRNPNVSYFIRYNTMQAILINISLIIINFLFKILSGALDYSLLIRSLSNTIFISLLAIVIFSIFQCLQGKEPDIPGISNAVRIQL